MEMKSMKMSATESKMSEGPMTTKPSMQKGPKYPYGLCLRLEDGSIEKLGMKSLPKVGAVVSIEAKGNIKSMSEDESMGNGKRRMLEIQITDLAFESEKKDASEILYKT